MKITRARCLALFALGVVGLSAQARDDLSIGVQLEPPVLDPAVSPAQAISEVAVGNIFEGLVRFDANAEARPLLAQSWEISADGLSYVFHLREGVRFHDGTVFDAGTAKFSLDRARAADSVNPQKARLQRVREVQVIDSHTLRLVLSRRSASLLQSLAWGAFVMQSPASAAQNATHPVGTGPFTFLRWRRGDSIEMLRNEHYWGARPRLTRAVFKFISEPTAAYAALMAGDVQAFPNYPAPESLAQFKADPRFTVSVGSSEGETTGKGEKACPAHAGSG